MNPQQVYDLIGIGIGPFNLGLAALSAPVKGLSTLFLDQSASFDWHPGLMLDDATLQVPFMADLVTMADPTSPYSLLNYLKENNRIYKFYIRESFFVYRREYNLYCQWVAARLDNCRFGQQVIQIDHADGRYQVTTTDTHTGAVAHYACRKLVLGTGTQPYIPDVLRNARPKQLIHTSDYLHRKTEVLQHGVVTLVGSGQSAAEIFRDLLPETRNGLQLNWVTRSNRFFPLENHAKLTLEMTSPDYVDYFYALPEATKKNLLATQQSLYKGINYDLINDIYNSMYAIELADGIVNASLRCNSSLQSVQTGHDGIHTLTFKQEEQDIIFEVPTDYIIMATGYKYHEPGFLRNIQDRIKRNADGTYAVHRNYSIDHDGTDIYVQNAELHSHGFVSPDLGMGAYRNASILNEVLGKEVYTVEQKVAFQQFEAAAVLQPA